MTAPRLLVVSESTAIGAVVLADTSIHRLVELYEERQADPNHPTPYMIVILRTPGDVSPVILCGSAVAPEEVLPEDRCPGLTGATNADPYFFDSIDLVVPTPGSSADGPRLVGLPTGALMALAKTTELVLEGPGRWILAMSTHHIADAMILLRATVAETDPQVVDTSRGFSPRALLPAIQGTTQDGISGYLSLAPTQSVQCLDVSEEAVGPMCSLASILVGGAVTNQQLLTHATEAGLKVCLTCGMTETTGGCVYDGKPLLDTSARTVGRNGCTRLAIHGPALMTRYLDARSPFLDEGGHRWPLTGNLGIIRISGTVEVRGCADDVIVSSGLSITPGPVRPVVRFFEGVPDVWIMDTPDEEWGHVVTVLVVVNQMPPDSLGMAELGSAVREYAAAHIGYTQTPCRIVAVESPPYPGFDKIDRAATAQAAAEAPDTEWEWVR